MVRKGWVWLILLLITQPAWTARDDLLFKQVLDAYLVPQANTPAPLPRDAKLMASSKAYRNVMDKADQILSSKYNNTKQSTPVDHDPATGPSRPQVSDIGSSLRSRLRAQIGTGVTTTHMARMTQAQSLQTCAARLHRDITDGISDAVIEDAQTGLISLLIDGIVVILTLIVVTFVVIFLLSTADKQSGPLIANFQMTVNPAIMAIVWPLMENDVTINLVDSATSALMNAVAQKIRYTLTVTIANYLSQIVSLQLYTYIMEEELPVLAAGVAHRTLHAVVMSLTRSLTRSLTHTIPRYVRGILAKNTVRLFYCVYCYREGQFCSYCFSWSSFGDPQKTKSMEPDMFMIKTDSYYD